MHDAASNGHLEVIQLLLDNGASAIAKTDDGETPLHFLKSWHKSVILNEEESALYDSLVQRMTTILEKSGHSTDVVLTNRINNALVVKKEISCRTVASPTKKQTPQKKIKNAQSKRTTPVKTQVGNARRSLETNNDFDLSSSHSSSSVKNYSETKDPALCYKQVMHSLRNPIHTDMFKKRKSNDMIKQPALIPADDVDDWLEDDLNANTSKKRRTSLTENLLYSSSNRNQGSSSEKDGHRTSFRKMSTKNSFSDLDVDFDNEAADKPVEINTNNYEDDFASDSGRGSHSSIGKSKRKIQSSLIDAGFLRSKTSQTTHSNTHHSASEQWRPNPLQLANRSVFHEASVPSPVTNSQQTVVESTLSVDVRIDGRLYRVPMSASEMRTCTIKWLAEEASKRYSRYVTCFF